MKAVDEDRLVARGLGPAGALLLVRKRLESTNARRLRIIVTKAEAAAGLVEFFDGIGIGTETDRAGDDYHVIADVSQTRNDD